MAAIRFSRQYECKIDDSKLLAVAKELLKEWEGESDTIGIQDIVMRCATDGLLDGAKPLSDIVEVSDGDWSQDFYTLEQFKAELES